MSGSIVEPHDKMRGRDVSKVARGEQAPRPPQQSPQVSRAPPPSSTTPKVETETTRSLQLKKENLSNQMRRCYDSYYDYHKKREQRHKNARRSPSTTNQCVQNGLKSGELSKRRTPQDKA
ncbi:putative cytochrome c oxidase subunit 6b-like isoform X1 [Sesamum indicum]|uniref:Cytochrome c oxidase subunit 6b-like isoform X1 n=1 Tax=Sesamum indicum TaxID=4182 RepID=A0A6I9TLM2_SESIN|nr:putative cytochrome c oxidase subunit 6b-like isoform X1 [Sesamum indicum]